MRSKSRASIEQLRAIPLFKRLSDRELACVDQLVDRGSVKAGQVLINEGSLPQEVYVIIEGEAEVTRHGEHLGTLAAGDCCGEMSLLMHSRRTATVTATTPMQVLVLDNRRFKELLENAEIVRTVLTGVAGRLQDANEQLTDPEPLTSP